jgi:DNA-binding MarR family transcriptional regulator
MNAKSDTEFESSISRGRLELLVELLGAFSSSVLTTNLLTEGQASGLTIAQWEALAFLARHGGCSSKALAEGLRISVPSATRLVDRLTRKSLVDRRESEEDRRLVILTLTNEGCRALSRVREARAILLEHALRTLPASDREALLALLEHFLRAVLSDAHALEVMCRHCGTDHTRDCVVNEAHLALLGTPVERT